ncbi:hypothetical protein CEXT_114271 [Caerostris extrusa]|uniref:Uncharacterized protein n=1 Tax=Caerostris extrusa TaxID=172846 RepID=A0AAV4PMA5_CAEEX|nr:hypothetical protein CEXT_114271 [Caerostris extrusa]
MKQYIIANGDAGDEMDNVPFNVAALKAPSSPPRHYCGPVRSKQHQYHQQKHQDDIEATFAFMESDRDNFFK